MNNHLEEKRREKTEKRTHQCLVENLVNEAKVEAKRLLTQHTAVILEHCGQPVEQVNDEGGRYVELGGGDKVQIVGLHKNKLGPVNVLNHNE